VVDAPSVGSGSSGERVLTKVTVELPLAIGKPLDYALPEEFSNDDLLHAAVEVTVGVRPHIGVITGVNRSDVDSAEGSVQTLKSVRRWICGPLPAPLVRLAEFVAQYYQVPLGMACGLITPPDAPPAPEPSGWVFNVAGKAHAAQIPPRHKAQRDLAAQLTRTLSGEHRAALSGGQRRTLNDWTAAGFVDMLFARDAQPALVLPQLPEFTTPQRNAADALRSRASEFSVSLLHGVTGSGKTEVYLDVVASILNAGKQVLLLVPEINLTPQLIDRVLKALPGVATAVLHSKLAAGERNRAWHRVHSGVARLIIGTRLAVFAPASNLGLIVIDEEHDGSYKQNESPRYHARDVAIVRAKQANIPVVLASATPSLETWRNVRHARSEVYQYIVLNERATAAEASSLRLVPSRGRRVKSGLSEALADGIAERLKRNEQSLVLVNRRGFAPALYCPHCGWSAPCKRCDAKLTLHQTTRTLRCHHCGSQSAVPSRCPSCGHPELVGAGVGTQKLEVALRETFPDARIERADTDSLSGKHAWRELYERILARDVDIVVGTQMMAKGHDFPAITLVGVIDADRALFSTDFRAQEDLFALLTQVAGRAGRHALPGEVMVQTEFPDHPVFQALLANDYAGFADRTLANREAFGLPPASRMALIRAEAKDATAVSDFFTRAHAVLREALSTRDGEVFAPQPAPLARKADFTRWTMTAIAPKVRPLAEALAELREAMQADRPKVRWAVDVDPYDFG
jgi:primosomal protein N' (replication factor Y) (superfamily II helicase)